MAATGFVPAAVIGGQQAAELNNRKESPVGKKDKPKKPIGIGGGAVRGGIAGSILAGAIDVVSKLAGKK